MTGTADSLADLLMREPLRRQAGLTLDPATVKGQAEGDLALDLKLGKTARPEDTQFHASGALDNLQIEKFLADEKLEFGDGLVRGRSQYAEDRGRRQSSSAPRPMWRSPARPARKGSATVTFALDAAGRAKRGLNFGSWLTGPLPIKLKAPLTRANAEVEIDLTPAGVDNPVPGLSKPAGKPGKATFLVKPTPEGASLSNIAIELGVPMLRGSAQMDPAGAIESATITQARIAPGDDFKVDVVNGPASLKVSVRGASLDARAFVKSILDGGLVRTNRGEGLRPRRQDRERHRAPTNRRSRTWSSRRSGAAAKRGSEACADESAAGAVTATGSGGETRISTTDAGALLRFANLYSHLEGGDLNLLLRSRGEVERRRGDAHRLRPARRTGVSPAGQRRAAACIGRRSRGQSMRRAFVLRR